MCIFIFKVHIYIHRKYQQNKSTIIRYLIYVTHVRSLHKCDIQFVNICEIDYRHKYTLYPDMTVYDMLSPYTYICLCSRFPGGVLPKAQNSNCQIDMLGLLKLGRYSECVAGQRTFLYLFL